MDYNRLELFRHNLYHGCLKRAADAFFELSDALLTDTTARSLVELSLAPAFRRRWPSVYAALNDVVIDRRALTRLFTSLLPRHAVGRRLVLGLDTSSILRPEAITAPDRTLVYHANLPAHTKPVSPGWLFSALVVLPEQLSSWTYVLDHRRVSSKATASAIGIEQLQQVLPMLSQHTWGRPLLLLDRHYSSAPWVLASGRLPLEQLIRARADQVLYRPAPPPSSKRGAPRKDGERFKGSDVSTHAQRDGEWHGNDERGRPLHVTRWTGLHLRKARDVTLNVIRVERAGVVESKRERRVSWFWERSDTPLELSEVASLYARRFAQEHGYRFDKQQLLWDTPQVRTPEQFERWTLLVAIAHNQLVLARPQATAHYRAWECKRRSASPAQVRRQMAQIIAQVGTPTRRPQVRGKSSGRRQGARIKPAQRQEVVRKGQKQAQQRSARC